MADAAAVLNAIGGGGFAPFQVQGMGDRKGMLGTLNLAGDYVTNGIDVSKIANYFGYLESILCLSMGGYLFEYVPSTKKLKVMLPAAAHTHAVTLDGGATNYPAQDAQIFYQGTITANSTKYLGQNGVEAASAAAAVPFVVPAPGFLRGIVGNLGTAPGGAVTYVLTVEKNGADTALTMTFTGAGTTAEDLTHSDVAVAKGDLITIKAVEVSGGAAANLSLSLIYEITDGARGILTTDAASASGGTAGVAVELGNGTAIDISDIPFLAIGY